MFRILIQQARIGAKQQTRQYAQSHRYRPNPGVRRQAKAETNETEYESSEWDDDLSKNEGDFSSTSETYQQYRQETRTEAENLRRSMVRKKYFNEKQLSFLTWAEMEQIRLLNGKDPEEWNEQRLAESFPSDVPTIRKILKANWQPSDGKRVVKHDEMVRLNWKSFVNGEIKDIDPRFSDHLRKFSARNLNQKVDYDSFLKKEMPKPESNEFSGIITSCKKYKEEPKQITSDHSVQYASKLLANESTKEKFSSQSIDSHKLYTFKPSNSNKDTSLSSSNEAETIFNNPSGTGLKKQIDSNREKSTVNTLAISKYETNEVQLDEHEMKQLSVSSIRHHIEIPDKLFKEGATYRLRDCYYDDDGEFLYRVPGMTIS